MLCWKSCSIRQKRKLFRHTLIPLSVLNNGLLNASNNNDNNDRPEHPMPAFYISAHQVEVRKLAQIVGIRFTIGVKKRALKYHF